MLSTKDIYVEICNKNNCGHQLTDAEIEKLQSHLMQMYRDLETVFKRHNLTYTLAYGNVIGAMRHKGWIPWDDDLDLYMPRKDYDIFLTKYAKELPSKYKVYAPHTENGPINRFAKIIDTETTFVQIGEEKKPYHQGVFIDIFPLESISDNTLKNRLSKLWSFFMIYTATSVDQAQHSSDIYKQIMCSTTPGKINYIFRKIWGKVFSFASATKWYRWIDKFHANDKETGYVHIPTGVGSKPWQLHKKSLYLPGHEVQYGNYGKVMVPGLTDKDTKEYLTWLYGDWETIPPAEKIWHHYVIQIEIP